MFYSSKPHFTDETKETQRGDSLEQEGRVKVAQAGGPSQGFTDGQTAEKARWALVFSSTAALG